MNILLRKTRSLGRVLRRRYGRWTDRRAYMRTEDFRRIQALRDSRKGQVGWLIGNGPSVRTEELDRLMGQCTFCCNRIHLAFDQMELRPAFTLSTDRQVVEDFGEEIVENAGGTVLFSTQVAPQIPGSLWIPSISNGSNLVFSSTRLTHVTPAGGTLFSGLQLGYFMGIRRFYLYGVDHSFTYESVDSEDEFRRARGDSNHFISGYRSGKAWAPPIYEMVEKGFMNADAHLRSQGGFVVNATHGGKLEVLQRCGFEEACAREGIA